MGALLSFFSRSHHATLSRHDKRLRDEVPPGTVPHEFIWKHGGTRVILTGTFDNWSVPAEHQMHLDRSQGVHRLLIPLDPSREWQFKFVVDGVWRCSLDYATVRDVDGNVNNVIYPDQS